MLADVVTAPQENRKPGVNPGRYRRCMRGGATLDESRSLGKPEKAVWSLGCVSQKNCLNVERHMGLQVRAGVIFVAEKRLQRLVLGLLQLLLLLPGCNPLCTDSADDDDPQRQLNIAYRSGQVIR